MVKLVFCLSRRPELTREAFQTYWREQHAPLVRSHAEALGLVRYVQTHSLPAEDPHQALLATGRGGPMGFDGVAELWWASLETLDAALATEAGRRAGAELLEDERRFIDLERSPIWLAEEHEIVA